MLVLEPSLVPRSLRILVMLLLILSLALCQGILGYNLGFLQGRLWNLLDGIIDINSCT